MQCSAFKLLFSNPINWSQQLIRHTSLGKFCGFGAPQPPNHPLMFRSQIPESWTSSERTPPSPWRPVTWCQSGGDTMLVKVSHAWRGRRSYVCWFIWTISYIFFLYHIISPLINPSSPKISQGKCWTLTCHQIAGCWTLHHRRDDPFWSSVLTWTSSVCSSGPGDGGEVSSCICCILFGLVTKVFNQFQ